MKYFLLSQVLHLLENSLFIFLQLEYFVWISVYDNNNAFTMYGNVEPVSLIRVLRNHAKKLFSINGNSCYGSTTVFVLYYLKQSPASSNNVQIKTTYFCCRTSKTEFHSDAQYSLIYCNPLFLSNVDLFTPVILVFLKYSINLFVKRLFWIHVLGKRI